MAAKKPFPPKKPAAGAGKPVVPGKPVAGKPVPGAKPVPGKPAAGGKPAPFQKGVKPTFPPKKKK
jgi:hypothetical protein